MSEVHIVLCSNILYTVHGIANRDTTFRAIIVYLMR